MIRSIIGSDDSVAAWWLNRFPRLLLCIDRLQIGLTFTANFAMVNLRLQGSLLTFDALFLHVSRLRLNLFSLYPQIFDPLLLLSSLFFRLGYGLGSRWCGCRLLSCYALMRMTSGGQAAFLFISNLSLLSIEFLLCWLNHGTLVTCEQFSHHWELLFFLIFWLLLCYRWAGIVWNCALILSCDVVFSGVDTHGNRFRVLDVWSIPVEVRLAAVAQRAWSWLLR